VWTQCGPTKNEATVIKEGRVLLLWLHRRGDWLLLQEVVAISQFLLCQAACFDLGRALVESKLVRAKRCVWLLEQTMRRGRRLNRGKHQPDQRRKHAGHLLFPTYNKTHSSPRWHIGLRRQVHNCSSGNFYVGRIRACASLGRDSTRSTQS